MKTVDEAILKALWDGAKLEELMLVVPGPSGQSGTLETRYGVIEVRQSAYLPNNDEGFVVNKRAIGMGRYWMEPTFKEIEIRRKEKR